MSLNSLATFASEPLTAQDFFALDVDEKIKVELIGGALVMSPSAKPWHADVATCLLVELRQTLGREYKVFTDIDVILDEETVIRPDVFVTRAETYRPERVHEAADLALAIEIVSPGSKVNDRKVKPGLFRAAGIPLWRIERDKRQLYLVEVPPQGEEHHHLGTAALDVAGVKVVIDLDEIAQETLGGPE